MYLSSGCSVPLRTFFLLMCQLSSNVTSGSSLLFPPDAIFTLDSDPAPGTYSCPCCKLMLAGKCKYSIPFVLQKESLQCNFLLAQKWTVVGEMGLQYRPFLPFMQQKEEEIQGEENLGNSPFTTAQHERPLLYNVWWLFPGVLVVCRDTGIPLVLTDRAQINPRCLPCTCGSQGMSTAAYDLSIILSLLLFQTV